MIKIIFGFDGWSEQVILLKRIKKTQINTRIADNLFLTPAMVCS